MKNWRKSSYSAGNGACAELASWQKSSFSLSNGDCAEVASWRKSSRSNPNGACAELASWRKTSHSGGEGECLEAGCGGTVIGIRDTKQAHLGEDRTVLEFSATAFAEFTGRVKSGSVLT